MFLSKLAIINYKSCHGITLDFEKNDPNTFIGFNDAGKTVILKSVGCLLGNESVAFSSEGQLASDLSNTPIKQEEFENLFKEMKLPAIEYNQDSITIVGFFDFENNEITEEFKEKASAHLRWCTESFRDDKFVLLKNYSKEFPVGKYYTCCLDSKAQSLCLWNQASTVLDTHLKENGINKKDIENENNAGKPTNLEKFRTIYGKVETECKWSDYTESFKKDKQFFPIFRYLDWNVSMKAIETLASDTMASKIQQFREKLEIEARVLSQEVNILVNEELKSKTADLFNDLQNIRGLKVGINFSVGEKVSDIVIEKNSADGDVRIESQGEGIKKQIWFAFLRWASLQKISTKNDAKKYIWCFDEPEIHLYPSAQRELYEIIKKISEGIFQTIISTHSTIFIDRVNLENINQISLENGYSVASKSASVQDIHDSLGIKNSDILFFDKFFAVEGETDQFLIPYFYKLYFNRSIEDDAIQIINLHGADKRKHNKKLFEDILRDFKKTKDITFYFLDGDTCSKEENVCLIGKYDIEDSISNDVWIKIVKDFCKIDLITEDLEGLRNKLAPERDKKFHKLLSDFIASHQKNEENVYLPSKGSDLAVEIMKQITTIEDVPKEIIEYFYKLNKKVE